LLQHRSASSSRLSLDFPDLPGKPAYTLKPGQPSPGQHSLLRPPFAVTPSTGILTCFPSNQPKSVYLIELALEFSDTVLKKGGSLVAKCFEGAGIESLRGDFRDRFKRVSNFKPKASRDRSREIYIIGLEHKRNRFG